MTASPKIAFSKYSGAGNTFFLVDNRKGDFPLFHPKWISSLCYKNGVRTTDGIILLENSVKSDFRMRIFNSDGSEAEMCGNGLRCFIKYLQELGIFLTQYNIETGAISQMGGLIGKISGEHVITSMGSPHHFNWNISLTVEGVPFCLHFLNTGVPHAVLFLHSLQELEAFPVLKIGAAIRHHPYFSPHGTNVNFSVLEKSGCLKLITFERGVEGITSACGTGAVATAIAASHLHGLSSPISVHVPSGDELKVRFKKNLNDFSDVTLEGPAKKTGEGFFDRFKIL